MVAQDAVVAGRAAGRWSNAAWRSFLTGLAVAVAWVRARARHVGPGRVEAAVMLGAYGVYVMVRGVWGGTIPEGTANAVTIIDLEKDLGIWVEPAWQQFFAENNLGLPAWSAFYILSQVIVLPLTLFLVFRYRRDAYAFLRDMALLSWTAGVVWYALQPVAPPRLVESGLTDTVSAQTPIALDSDLVRLLYNPVAAMPSLHVGMAPVVAWALWKLTPWAWSRALGLLYPVIVGVSVVVTGNHYLLDIVGGILVVLPAAALAWWLTRAPEGTPAGGGVRPRAAGPPSAGPGRPGRAG
ncbi:MAG: phosphatase PAP2 family protein [Thermoleophilia bacterium]